MQIRQFFVSRLSLYLSTTSVFHCTDKLYVLTLMSQLDLWLENPPKKLFCFARTTNSVCGGPLFVGPLFIHENKVDRPAAANILDLSKHALWSWLCSRQIKFFAGWHSNVFRASMFAPRKKRGGERSPTGFTFMFINTRCHLSTWKAFERSLTSFKIVWIIYGCWIANLSSPLFSVYRLS